MIRFVLSFALAGVLAAAPALAQQVLPPGQIDGAGNLKLGPVTLGKRVSGRFIPTPDAIETKGDITCTSGACLISGVTGLNMKGTAGTTLFGRPALNLPNGTMLYSATDDFATPKGMELRGSTLLFAPTEEVRILPLANSLAKALHVVQSGPASGSVAGPVLLNSFDMSWSSGVTGNYGTPGLVGAGAVIGQQFSLNVGGPNLAGTQFFALSAGLTHDRADTSTGDKVAFSAGVHSSASTSGLMDAAVLSVVADSGSSSPQIAGLEVDMTIIGTGTTPNRLGVVVVNTGSKRATSKDIAYALTSAGPDGTFAGSFDTMFGLYKQSASLPNAMPATGRIFASDHALTLAHILDGSNITVTGTILNFPGVILAGDGTFTTSTVHLYAPAGPVPAGQISYGSETAASSNCGSLAAAAGCIVTYVGGRKSYTPYY